MLFPEGGNKAELSPPFPRPPPTPVSRKPQFSVRPEGRRDPERVPEWENSQEAGSALTQAGPAATTSGSPTLPGLPPPRLSRLGPRKQHTCPSINTVILDVLGWKSSSYRHEAQRMERTCLMLVSREKGLGIPDS